MTVTRHSKNKAVPHTEAMEKKLTRRQRKRVKDKVGGVITQPYEMLNEEKTFTIGSVLLEPSISQHLVAQLHTFGISL